MTTVQAWRAADGHTGIDVTDGIPSTYRHLEGRQWPAPLAEVYRVESFIVFGAPTPIHVNVHYVPGDQLDEFFCLWGEHSERVVDIRPLTAAEADAELEAFRAAAESHSR